MASRVLHRGTDEASDMSSSGDTDDDSGSEDPSSMGEKTGAAGLMERFDAYMSKDAREMDGVRSAFYAMQWRRLRRAESGDRLQGGKGLYVLSSFLLVVLVGAVAGEFVVLDFFRWDSRRFAENVWFHAIPFTVTVVITAHVSLSLLSHGGKLKFFNVCAWGAITWVYWDLWYNKMPTRMQWATAALAVYAVVLACLAAGKMFVYRTLLRYLVSHAVGAQSFWRVRRKKNARSHRYTYVPKGWFGCRRYAFNYEGERDSQKRPHGVGTWRDCTSAGETLYGVWEHGKPSGAFISWETGTTAQTMQSPVGYVTCRSDCPTSRLGSNSFFPAMGSRLRHGVAQVEVSYAGGFMPFLPALGEVRSWFDFRSMIDALLEAVSWREKIMRLSGHGVVPGLQVDVVDSLADLPRDPNMLEAQVTIRAIPGGRVGYVERSALGPTFGLVEAKREACVFIHGFGVDLATAMERIAQICALGGMPVNIVPLVFSWSSADSMSALVAVNEALKQIPSYEKPLRQLFGSLAEHFEDVHVLTHSMGARLFYMNFEEVKGCFRPAQRAAGPDPAGDSGDGDGARRRLRLRNLVTMNPAVMVERVSRVLPEIMNYAERYTTYNDRYDKVVELDKLNQKVFFSSSTGSRSSFEALPFGRVVRPLWLERDPSGSYSVGGLPKREDGLDHRQRYVLRRGMSKIMDRWFDRGGASEEKDATSGSDSGSDAEGGGPRRAGGDDSRIDVVDCTHMDSNASASRHNYYGANATIARDVCCLIGERREAARRPGLARKSARGNVYDFSIAPSGYSL